MSSAASENEIEEQPRSEEEAEALPATDESEPSRMVEGDMKRHLQSRNDHYEDEEDEDSGEEPAFFEDPGQILKTLAIVIVLVSPVRCSVPNDSMYGSVATPSRNIRMAARCRNPRRRARCCSATTPTSHGIQSRT